MLKNHLKIAIRNLRRRAGFSVINVVGLAAGLACCLLIVLYVRDEVRYDRFHANAERIFRVTRPTAAGSHWAPIGPPVGPALKASLPEVEEVVRFFPLSDEFLVRIGDERFEAPGGVYVDSTVFDVFTIPLQRGDPATALAGPDRVVISASMARRLFGDADPMGRTMQDRPGIDWTVTGVMENLPATTHLPFEFMVSMRTYTDREAEWINEARSWAGFYTYLLLRDRDAAARLDDQLTRFVDTFFASDFDGPPSAETQLALQPLTDIHLHSQLEKEYRPNGDIAYVYIFSAVALFVLLIACINFINLATARAGTRLREVGVRKSLGSTRVQLARQFLAESMLTAGLALALAYVLVVVCLPVLNQLTGKALTLTDVHTLPMLLGLVGLALLTGLASGFYPAVLMAGFSPTQALRGATGPRAHAVQLRKGLVVFQFALSIFMLAGTALVYQQLRYVRSTALGFDKEQVVNVQLSGEAAYFARQNLESFRQELLRHPAIAEVSLAADAPGERYSLESLRLEGQEDGTMMRIAWGVDHDYARTLGLTLSSGRDFSREAPADTNAWLLNEAAVRRLELIDPIGQVLRWGDDYIGPIVGVVEDFHFASLHHQIEPLVIPLRPGVGNRLLVRVQGGGIQDALAHVEAQIERLAPGPFRYAFLDDDFDQLYRQEARLGEVFGYFTAIAMLIACLGLFGLAAFTAEQRTKEIGIRKVLGASVSGIVALLSKEFIALVVVAFGVAAPAVYLVMRHWLDNFAYRAEMPWWVFAAAGLAALVAAMLTVSYHAVRTATADPVKALRYE